MPESELCYAKSYRSVPPAPYEARVYVTFYCSKKKDHKGKHEVKIQW